MQIDTGMTQGQQGTALNLRFWGGPGRLTLPSREFLAATTIFAAVSFNFLLAVLNANFMNLGRGDVILAEVLIVGTSVGLCLWSRNKLLIQWAIVAWVFAIIFMALSVFRQTIEPKYFRDILAMPVFIALGITYARGNIVRLFAVLQGFILFFMIVEGYSGSFFGDIANPLKYYINTRDFVQENFWNTESTLFISATRPQARFFEWLDIHRLSSVFLEPVSLGNWCIVVTIFVVAMWRDLSRNEKYFFIITNVIILIGCDGRLATVTSGFVIAVALLAPKLPRYSHAFYLPAAVAAAVLIVLFFNPPPGDTFLGRLEYTVRSLGGLDLMGVLGLDLETAKHRLDSGITYIILTQSIFGATLFWGSICFLQSTTNRRAVVLVHAIAAYVALSLLISYSMFSVKTAAPLWFLYGYARVTSERASGRKSVLPEDRSITIS